MKFFIKNTLIKAMIPSLSSSHHGIDRLVAHAANVYLGRESQSSLLNELDEYYAGINIEELKSYINYDELLPLLRKKKYKVDILNYKSTAPALWNISKIWDRRLSLLRHFGIRFDLMILSDGEQIPPHAHQGVISGFIILEGRAAIRHFHVEEYLPNSVMARLSVDRILENGEYTVNSENKDNIHWLKSVGKETILFRFNITKLPSNLPSYENLQGRLYVDPSKVSSHKLQELVFINEQQAKRINYNLDIS